MHKIAIAILVLITLTCLSAKTYAIDQANTPVSSADSDLTYSSANNQTPGIAVDPLLGALQISVRCQKANDSKKFIELARILVSKGYDVRAVDKQKLTPLHWTVIGGICANDVKQAQAYGDLATLLISGGADVNAEDEYGNTPLDWQMYSKSEELLQVLLESGARHGYSQDETLRLGNYFNKVYAATETGDIDQIRAVLAADVLCGTELQIRLTTKVASNGSRAGDPVRAVVIAPVMVEGRMVVAPGTPIEGSVMLARKSPNTYVQSILALDFANLIHSTGLKTRLATRLIDVDNARETVRAGIIMGAPFPNSALGKLGKVWQGIWFANPLLGWTLEGATYGYGKTYNREIVYDPGVEMTLRITIPERLMEIPKTPAWTPESPTTRLVDLVNARPMRTETPGQVPSDMTNLMFIGTREKLDAAFQSAGWVAADKLGITTGLKSFLATARNKGFDAAPVSLLLLNGQEPEVVYQKQNNTFAKRHHIRIWKQGVDDQGREIRVGASTHDIGIGVSNLGVKWFHKVDSNIDNERTKVIQDLLFTGTVLEYSMVDRPYAPRKLQNATGDNLRTDGQMAVITFK